MSSQLFNTYVTGADTKPCLSHANEIRVCCKSAQRWLEALRSRTVSTHLQCIYFLMVSCQSSTWKKPLGENRVAWTRVWFRNWFKKLKTKQLVRDTFMSLDYLRPWISANYLKSRTEEVGLFYQNTHQLKTAFISSNLNTWSFCGIPGFSNRRLRAQWLVMSAGMGINCRAQQILSQTLSLGTLTKAIQFLSFNIPTFKMGSVLDFLPLKKVRNKQQLQCRLTFKQQVSVPSFCLWGGTCPSRRKSVL